MTTIRFGARTILCGWMGLGILCGEAVHSGGRLPDLAPGVQCWWALSSAAKIRPAALPPEDASRAMEMRAAANEREAVQLLLRSERPLDGLRFEPGDFLGPGASRIAAQQVEVLQARYVDVAQATDGLGEAGRWPDPLLPVAGPVALAARTTEAFWLRLHVPKESEPGSYRGSLRLSGGGIDATVPVLLTVYGFSLPDRMSCVTAFGFSPGEVFRYQNVRTEADKRLVLAKYWENFAAHHISPYDPAPLDPFMVEWPAVRPPKTAWDDWSGLRIVDNEVHAGTGALLIHDDRDDLTVGVSYAPLLKIPESGLRLRFWYRTAIPGHRLMVSLNHHDQEHQWMSGLNNDITIKGNGRWEEFDRLITSFPEAARQVSFHARATQWTDSGGELGLVWFDDISITDAGSGAELLQGGDFEVLPRTEPVAPPETLVAKFDFSAWDEAMTRAIDRYGFNSFRLPMHILGGGTFHQLAEPNLLGFGENTPEYPLLLDSYCRQLEAHLRDRGWLDEAYVYWFDEPSPDQYAFVTAGFDKLKKSCPDIPRMLTEQVEPGLIGGPNLWCPISNAYDHARAEERRRLGEKFWWYVCTGPKAPYAGLFIDHPAPEMRIWLWQTFQHKIEGILVWQSNYWTSDTAYPDGLQDPYADPMSWTQGYGIPSGERRPWGNGDGRFVYPPPAAATGNPTPVLDGPVDSIRWEHLRDGIEDYEYLCVLRTLLAERKSAIQPARHRELSRLLEVPASISRSMTEFAPDGTAIETRRHQLARAIEALQKKGVR